MVKRLVVAVLLPLALALLDACGGDPGVEDLAGVYRFDPIPEIEGMEVDLDDKSASIFRGFPNSFKTTELTLSANGSYTWTALGLPPENGRWRIEGNRLFLQREKPTPHPVRKIGFLVRNGTLVLDPADFCPDQGLDEYLNPLVMRKE